MGQCFSTQNSRSDPLGPAVYRVCPSNLNPKEQKILKLIYNDLKLRIPEQALNLQNFLLFFHKNGFWGARLFQQFSVDESDLITEEQFVEGIAKLFKTNEDQKIELLFKFFASSNTPSRLSSKRMDSIMKKNSPNAAIYEQGVKFEEFLVMLYNYPKEDLKQILNDKDFFDNEIRKSLVSVGQNRRLDSVYKLGVSLGKKNGLVFRVDEGSEVQDPTRETEPQVQPSLVSNDILKHIKRRQADETTLKLKDGQNMLEIKTNNIHHLVKKFAINMFKSLKLNCRTGKLNMYQFSEWVKGHKNLYHNYYSGFHNNVWQIDNETNKPGYLSEPLQKQSYAKYQASDKSIKVFLILKNSILVVNEGPINQQPIDIICLEGLEVTKIFQDHHGYGIQIAHRDIYYPFKRFFFKNQSIRDQWGEHLKYYKGGSIENLYSMGRKIGTGKFSVVYEAENRESKAQVAIKVIEYKQLDMDARRLIAHESSVMQVFSHPLLVQFKDCIQTKTHMYIITELCPGKDLFQLVKQYKYFPQTQAAYLTQQVIVGVRYMHSLGIIHRDLKPQNIMVYYNSYEKKIETVKIIDFGFANYMSTFKEMQAQDILVGTPNYIAPQLLRGQGISFKSDNFAIGSILYFMLSGTLAFNGYNLTDVFDKTLDGNYSLKGRVWDKISQNAKDLIDGLLKVQTKDRLSLEDALKHPWFKQMKKQRQNKQKSSEHLN